MNRQQKLFKVWDSLTQKQKLAIITNAGRAPILRFRTWAGLSYTVKQDLQTSYERLYT